MDDTISRVMAINALESIGSIDTEADKEYARSVFEALPSAQPEYKELQDWKTDFKGFIGALDMPRDDYRGIMEYIDEVPSAEPERKKGKWINRSLNILYPEWERYTCSACGKHSYNYDFCPNCGSYNGGESDDKG